MYVVRAQVTVSVVCLFLIYHAPPGAQHPHTWSGQSHGCAVPPGRSHGVVSNYQYTLIAMWTRGVHCEVPAAACATRL